MVALPYNAVSRAPSTADDTSCGMQRTKRLPRHTGQQKSSRDAAGTSAHGSASSSSGSQYDSESDGDLPDDTTPRIGFGDQDATLQVGSTSHIRTELDLWGQPVGKNELTFFDISDRLVDDGWDDEDPFAFFPLPPPTERIAGKNTYIATNEPSSAKWKDCFRREKRLPKPTLSLAWPKIEEEDELASLEEASKILAIVPGVMRVSPDARFCDDGYEETLRRRSLSNASERD